MCGGGLLQVQARQQLAALLIRKCASVHALDMQQCTPLHLACKSGLLELTSCLIGLGAHVDTRTESGRAFVIELLNKFVKKYIVSNLLQENAIVPYPRGGGSAVDIPLPGDINTLQAVEPDRIHMFHVTGFQFSQLVDFAAELRRRDELLDPRWAELLDEVVQRDGRIARLAHLCRLGIRARLGVGVRDKVERLSVLLPPAPPSTDSANASSQPQQHRHLKLPTQLKDYLILSEINN